MNVLPAVKNFFSYFAFFTSEREIRQIQRQYQLRDNAYRSKLKRQEDDISQLENKVQQLEYEKKNSLTEMKKHFEQMSYLHKKLETTRKERDETRQRLTTACFVNHRLKTFITDRPPKRYHATLPSGH